MAAIESDYLDRLPCQNTGGPHVGFDRPWRGEKHATDKERFFRYVRANRYNGHQTRIVEAVKAIYGDDYTNTEYRRLSRLANRSDWFVVGPNKTVEPHEVCFKAGNTSGGLETAVSVTPKDVTSGDSECQNKRASKTGQSVSEKYPKDRVRSVLDKRVRLDAGKYKDKHDYRPELFRELATYRSQVDDLFCYFRRKHEILGLPNYFVRSYQTRFNDTAKAAEIREGFAGALQTASESFRRGALLSLTVDPQRFESHAEAEQAASEAASDLINREAYQLGFRPEYVRVVDYQESGLIHFHVCLFGVRVVTGETQAGEATVSEQHVREYWDTQKGIGSQVSVQPIYERGGDWIIHDDDGGRQTVRLYLGKRIRELDKVVSMSADELRDMAESGNISLWRHTLFWASERRYYTASRSLEGVSESDGGKSRYQWVFVGVCRFEQIPQNVLDDSVNYGRRPPPETASRTESPGVG